MVAGLRAVSDTDFQNAVETAANGIVGTPVSYFDRITLAGDQNFLRRLQIAVAKFATYILNEDPATPNHPAALRLGQKCNPQQPGRCQRARARGGDGLRRGSQPSRDQRRADSVGSRVRGASVVAVIKHVLSNPQPNAILRSVSSSVAIPSTW